MLDETLPGTDSNPIDPTSLSLLERIRKQDDAAWERFVKLYGPLVFSWCRGVRLSAEDAHDIVQNVFLAVAKNIERFRRDRPADTFRGWLRVIAQNEIRMYFRRARDRAVAAGGTDARMRMEAVADDELEESDAADQQEQGQLYQRALQLMQSEFKERTWRAFLETTVHQRSSVDVAADLGMTPGAVRQAKYAVLRRLRVEFGELLQ